MNRGSLLRHPTPRGAGFMQPLKAFEDTVAAWPRISVYSHRFGGREYRFANAEVGHVHDGGIVDIPFRVRNNTDLPHAVWLMRLSYFRYALKAAADPRGLFSEASQELQLTARF